MFSPRLKKGIVKVLVFSLLATSLIIPAGQRNVQASSRVGLTEMVESRTASALTLTAGAIVSGTADFLASDDQKAMTFNSTKPSTTNEVSFYSEIPLGVSGASIYDLDINSTAKASLTNTDFKMYLYNFTTNNYEVVKSGTIGSTYAEQNISIKNINSIRTYVSSSNSLRVRFVLTNASAFSCDFDFCNVVYSYQNSASDKMVKTYNVDNSEIEFGTVVTGSVPTSLQDRDGTFYSVTSASNKVAWSSKTTLDESKGSVKTLEVNYGGKYSVDCNVTWFSLWNYETNNWQAIDNFTSTTENKSTKWTTSDPVLIGKFISEFGDVKIRVYNSATQQFTRDTDYLNITVYYTTQDSVKAYSPDTIDLDYGTVVSGNVQSVNNFDQGYYVVKSDATNKVAWKCESIIDVDKQYIKAISVVTKVKTDAATNSLNLSLWDNTTNSYKVVRVQSSSTDDENLIATITDPELISKYVGANGSIKARLYNSATAAFNRSTDYIMFEVEYGTVGTFEIAQLSDVHELMGSPNFKAIINELNTKVNPKFTIVTGDITDHGTDAQYNQYLIDKQLFTSPVYTTTGNHDVRWWNSNGKNDWKDRIGPLYYSFNYGGVHFVLLDSTIAFNLDEKFDKQQLEWLQADLQAVGKKMPVMIFAHHPFKIQNNATGRKELFNVIKDYNVVSFQAGHQHYYGIIDEDGISTNYITYIKDNVEQNYVSIKFTPNKFYIYKRKASDSSSTLWVTGTMNNTRKADVKITQANVQANGNVDVRVTVNKAPDGVTSIKARIDNYGPYTTLTKSGNEWIGTIDAAAYSPAIPYGKHFVGIEMLDENNRKWTDYKEYDWIGGLTTTKWVFQTGNMIQSSPTYYNNTIYAGSEDGKIYAINDADGTLKWSYQTGDQIISKPAIYERTGAPALVIVGSHDKKLYALDSATGSVVWTYQTTGSVISDPLVDNGVVYFGSGDKNVYAVNANTGAFKWKYQTEGLMRQRPIILQGKLYVNIRDTYIWYAFNINDGSLYWRGNAGTDESLFVCGDVRPIMTPNNKLWCIDAQNTRPGYLNTSTGALQWFSTTIGNVSSRGMDTDGQRVFFVGGNGRQLYAIDSTNDTQVWYKDMRANASDSDYQAFQVDCGLVYKEGILYHVAEKGRITGIDPVTGNTKFVYDAVGFPERILWSTPEVNNKTVYVGGLDGKIYAVKYNGN